MIDRDKLIAAVAAYKAAGKNVTKAAEGLGISRTTLQYQLKIAGEQGFDLVGEVPVGMKVKAVSLHHNKDGDLTQAWTKADVDKVDYVLAAVDEVLSRHTAYTPLPPRPARLCPDLVTFYNIADPHIGMYSWAPETGDDYDTEIAKKVLLETTGKLVSWAPPSEHAVVLNLGDYFHVDNERHMTERSGNIQDVDTRFQRVLEVGEEVMVNIIDMALQKHNYVTVRNVRGNHDRYASLALGRTIRGFYRNNPRVFVDTNPSPLWIYSFGKVLVGATHGDTIKPDQAPGTLASFYPKEWGEARHRYIYLGHVHHSSKGGGEKQGAVWETFRTLAPKDAWHKSSGYSSGRAMSAITHHREGDSWRHDINLG